MRFLLLAALAGLAFAQPKGPPPPPPLACGVHGEAEVICGTRSPEDLELTPDGKSLLVAQFANSAANGGGISLFDPAKKTFTKLPITVEPLKDWGDPSCPGPIGDALGPHGISLAKRNGGKWQLFIVNHGGRESIEMFELKQTSGAYSLIWHGCVPSKQAFNDVAALADGSFIATHPTALNPPPPPGAKGGGGGAQLGAISGYVSRWSVRDGESELPGTRMPYPNGVIATPDGHFAYINAWTASEVRKYDVREGKEVGMVKLDFMPDNLTWTKKGHMLAAGIKGIRGDCPAGSGAPCQQAFGISVIDPGKMTQKTVFDSVGKGALIPGVSVALQMGSNVYVGAFNGDRIVKLTWKE